MTAEPDLHALQLWMQSVIMHAGGVSDALDRGPSRKWLEIDRKDIERVIQPSQNCTSIERLSVYNSAYFARLIECLQAEYPAVSHAVGIEAFSSFVVGYLGEYPSVSYTLADLSRDFAGYLQEIRPPRSGGSAVPDWADFVIDLATLERHYAEVFDGPGEERVPKLSAECLLNIPPERRPEVVLTPAPSLRLAEFRFPVHEYAAAVRGRGPAPVPPAEPTRLAIHRRDYIVRRHVLGAVQFAVLKAIGRGMPLGEAVGSALVSTSTAPAEIVAQIESWFREWTNEGFFIEAHVGTMRDGEPTLP